MYIKSTETAATPTVGSIVKRFFHQLGPSCGRANVSEAKPKRNKRNKMHRDAQCQIVPESGQAGRSLLSLTSVLSISMRLLSSPSVPKL